MLLTAGERKTHGAAVHGARRARRRGRRRSPAARPASSPTPPTARPRSSRSRATGSATAIAAGQIPVVAGFQGVSTDERRDDPRPGRLRHHRGRARRGVRRRRLRDLHRRHRRVHRRPAHRAERPPAQPRLVRRDARDGRHRRSGARAALGRVRPQPPRAAARPLELHLGAGHVGHRGGCLDGSTRSSPPSPTTPSEAKVTITGCPTSPASRRDCSAPSPTSR